MIYKSKRNLIISAIVFLTGIFAGGYIINHNKYIFVGQDVVLVSSVIDGDTIKLEDGQRVRLIGINSPERGECYYREAGQALRELIDGKYVKIIKDVSDKDKYDRLLRHIILPIPDSDDIIVAQYLVANGHAEAITSSPDNRYRFLLSSAQQSAYKSKLGMWGACDYEPENQSKREVDSLPSDPNCIIKGNISEKGFGKTYFIPGCDNYTNVKIDIGKGEQYFCTEKEAESAGFRRATNCP